MYDATSKVSIASYTGATQVAQIANGDQYITDAAMNLYYVDNQASPSTSTLLRANAVSVYASDTDVVYYTDNLGHIFTLTNLTNNSWTQLPAA